MEHRQVHTHLFFRCISLCTFLSVPLAACYWEPATTSSTRSRTCWDHTLASNYARRNYAKADDMQPILILSPLLGSRECRG